MSTSIYELGGRKGFKRVLWGTRGQKFCWEPGENMGRRGRTWEERAGANRKNRTFTQGVRKFAEPLGSGRVRS